MSETLIEDKTLALLAQAIEARASDIQLLPVESGAYTCKLRLADELYDYCKFPTPIAERIISHLKFLTGLDISERRKPQSGSFSKEVGGDAFSFRISTLPTVLSLESLSIRLHRHNDAKTLQELTPSFEAVRQLEELAEQRQGLVLFTGATGTGKTTSMYALTRHCAVNLARQVITLEDPVENRQQHLLQIQINEQAGLTYAAGIRSILRHAPDVILIGEIRDGETAKAAVQAALTGHLVISTIHARQGEGVLHRLLELGVKESDIRQTLLASISQVLVRAANSRTARLTIQMKDELFPPRPGPISYRSFARERGGSHAITDPPLVIGREATFT